jgi:hypothetical protein
MICWCLMEAWITAISQESRNSCLTPPEKYDGGILEKPTQNDLWTRPKSFSQRGMGVGAAERTLADAAENGAPTDSSECKASFVCQSGAKSRFSPFAE